jgi:hypothetical protein
MAAVRPISARRRDDAAASSDWRHQLVDQQHVPAKAINRGAAAGTSLKRAVE